MIAQAKPFPTFARGYARARFQSLFPNLWASLAACWSPSIGPQGITNLLDFGPNRYMGTLNGSIPASAWEGSPFGWSLLFDGTNDYIETTFQPAFTGTNQPFSFAAWFKSTDANRGCIIGDFTSGTAGLNPLELSASGQMRSYLSTGAVTKDYVTTGTAVNDGLWHHAAMTYDGAQGLNIYLDGRLRPVTKTTDGTLSSSILGNSGAMRIGSDRRAASGIFLAGSLASVMAWRRCLSGNEIASLATGASPLSVARFVSGKTFGTSLTLSISDAITLSESRTSQPNVAKVDSIAMSEAIARAIGVAKTDSVTLSEARAMSVSFRVTDSVTVTSSSSGVVGVPTAWNISLLLDPTPSTSAMVFPTTSSTFSAAPTSSNFQV